MTTTNTNTTNTNTTNNNTDSIFNKGCLINLSMSVWGGTKKIAKSKVNEALESDWTKAQKNLVDSKELKAISQKRNAARIYIDSLSLPFPIKGISFVPIGLIDRIENKLQEFKADFDREVKIFCEKYPTLREQAQSMLNGLFNEADYPKTIDNKFNFEWRFITIGAPTENSMLNPEMVKRENERFRATMEEARQIGIEALQNEMKTLVSNMVDRLTNNADGSQKIFKRASINNFYEFFSTFNDRNIFENAELSSIIEKAKSCLGSTDFENLKNDGSLRENIKSGMAEINNMLDGVIENRPTRKLRIV